MRMKKSQFKLSFPYIMRADIVDATGTRGEVIVELCLTDFQTSKRPLFRLSFLGDKWPTIDFYALRAVRKHTPYFLAQVKATTRDLSQQNLSIGSKKADITRLLRIPGPTYIFGVHEPSKRVFVKSVHLGVPKRAITRIPLHNELTPEKLQVLYDEVRGFWKTNWDKPKSSVFA
jgi:hypothetical protein